MNTGMIKISKISLQKNWIFIKFLKIRDILCVKSANFFLLFYKIYITKRKCTQMKYKMDTKRPESLVYLNIISSLVHLIVFTNKLEEIVIKKYFYNILLNYNYF